METPKSLKSLALACTVMERVSFSKDGAPIFLLGGVLRSRLLGVNVPRQPDRLGIPENRTEPLQFGRREISFSALLGVALDFLCWVGTPTTARYSHLDADPLRRASESIAATIAASLDSDPGIPPVRHRRPS
jgi:hypothetical protein